MNKYLDEYNAKYKEKSISFEEYYSCRRKKKVKVDSKEISETMTTYKCEYCDGYHITRRIHGRK